MLVKKILIAPDKFKGSVTGEEICQILKEEIISRCATVEVMTSPLADGGDGSIAILSQFMEIEECVCDTFDPLGRPIKASYFRSEDAAFIELASASGLVLLDQEDRNPMYTSTYGTGLLIKEAMDQGLKHIYLFLGGSSSNDGGIGIAHALGYRFLDATGKTLDPIGASLKLISTIEVPKEQYAIEKFTICCDVNNPPFGKNGAAHTYGEQKGASEQEREYLDEGIQNLCAQLSVLSGLDLSNMSGGGAAGGTAICPTAFLGGEIISGMDFIAEITNLESHVKWADLVLSGEGALDHQSFNGKVISGVAKYCKKYDKPLWLVVGRNDLSDAEAWQLGADKVFSIFERAEDLADAMEHSKQYLREIGKEIGEENQILDFT